MPNNGNTDEPKIYTSWEEAKEAMTRGETVRVEVKPFPIDPVLLRMARNFQDKAALEEWKKLQGEKQS